MLLSEHVYCVAVAFKMTKWVEQWLCIKFSLSLNIPPWKLFRWFRRWQLWATGDWQLHRDNTPSQCLMSHVEVFGETSNHSGDSAPLELRFCALKILAFPIIKITFEREAIAESQWDSGKYNGAADGNSSSKGYCSVLNCEADTGKTV